MSSRRERSGYSDRLFAGGWRGYFHLARFKWVSSQIESMGCATQSVIELGCFDGKLLDFLPNRPLRYAGYDANWEGGLELAAAKWNQHPEFEFHLSSNPEDLDLHSDDHFDIAVAMETLEHISPQHVDKYLQVIPQKCHGLLFATVPNEKGLFFLVKYLVKRFLTRDADTYSFSEVVNATLGRLTRVARREHKGFDYSILVAQIERHFDVIEVTGFPPRRLPKPLCFTIGIVAKAKTPGSH